MLEGAIRCVLGFSVQEGGLGAALGVRSVFVHSWWFYAASGCVQECAFENARSLLRITRHVRGRTKVFIESGNKYNINQRQQFTSIKQSHITCFMFAVVSGHGHVTVLHSVVFLGKHLI